MRICNRSRSLVARSTLDTRYSSQSFTNDLSRRFEPGTWNNKSNTYLLDIPNFSTNSNCSKHRFIATYESKFIFVLKKQTVGNNKTNSRHWSHLCVISATWPKISWDQIKQTFWEFRNLYITTSQLLFVTTQLLKLCIVD